MFYSIDLSYSVVQDKPFKGPVAHDPRFPPTPLIPPHMVQALAVEVGHRQPLKLPAVQRPFLPLQSLVWHDPFLKSSDRLGGGLGPGSGVVTAQARPISVTSEVTGTFKTSLSKLPFYKNQGWQSLCGRTVVDGILASLPSESEKLKKPFPTMSGSVMSGCCLFELARLICEAQSGWFLGVLLTWLSM